MDKRSTQSATTTPNRTQTRELREMLSGPVTYTSGCGEGGQATWLNISRTGAALVLGRYLRPGRQISLALREDGDMPQAITAEIAWCAPVPGTLHFKAGLRILRNDPETSLSFAALGYLAQTQNKNGVETVTTAVWPSHNVTMAALPNADVIKLTQAV